MQLIADRVGAVSPQEIYSVVKLIKSELEGAAESADKYLALSSNPSKSTVREWRDRAELLRTFGELSNELNDNHIFGPKDVTTKARILSKPVPEYTEEARKNQATGTVILLLILTSDGKVKGFLPIATLPYGLTEMSIEAARRIRFSPATIDGKPVSQFIKVEYNFNIY